MNGKIFIGAALIVAALVYWSKPVMSIASRTLKKVSREGAEFIAKWEGFEPTAYQDIAGIWTIGYGHTGPDVYPGLTITREQALELLARDTAKFARAVNSLVIVPLTQRQFDRLVSLAYNIGENAFAQSTTLRELNRGNYQAAADAIELWNKSTINGVLTFVQGLANRRAEEKRDFLT